MAGLQTTITPHTQEPYVTRTYPSESELNLLIQNAVVAQKAWAAVPLEERVAIGRKFMVCTQINAPSIRLKNTAKVEFNKMRADIPLELSMQMGRQVI